MRLVAAVPLVVGCASAAELAGGDAPASPPDAAIVDNVDAGIDAAARIATFRNPLDAGPDPFLTFFAGNYYLATTQGDALRVTKAPSLAELAVSAPTTIWEDTEPSRSRDLWAPSFYRSGGRWYVYYTADDGIDEHHRIHVIESVADDPLGPYHFKATLEPPGATGLFAIDPVVLEQATGRYLVWSGAGSEGHNLIYLAPMSDPWTVSGARVYLPAAGGCSEVREAPSILQHDGTTFLVYSTCDTGKPDYQLWTITIPTDRDPMIVANWTQHPSPLFTRNDTDGVWGPGSNSFFTSPDGSETWVAYHAKNTSRFTYDHRTTRAQRIAWLNGMPSFGAASATGTSHDLPSGDPGQGSYFINDDGTSSGPGTVTFSSGWTFYPGCGVQCFMGDDHGTAATDATATFAFVGSQIALVGVRDAGNGIAAFSIDGGAETTRDTFAAIRQGELPIYTSPRLVHGPHELRVRVTGARVQASSGTAIGIDRAEVFSY